jgi:CheY-like chemotaxis protein
MMQTILQALNYEVLMAADGLDGWERFQRYQNRIEAVITDLMMPRMDGMELIQNIRGVAPAIPIIAVTGLIQMPGEPDRIGKLNDLNVRYILSKPFQATDLISNLEDAIAAENA